MRHSRTNSVSIRDVQQLHCSCYVLSHSYFRKYHISSNQDIINLIVAGHDIGDVKVGKTVPLQAWSGSEGSRKLRFPD
jgi:hypothetical protein